MYYNNEVEVMKQYTKREIQLIARAEAEKVVAKAFNVFADQLEGKKKWPRNR